MLTGIIVVKSVSVTTSIENIALLEAPPVVATICEKSDNSDGPCDKYFICPNCGRSYKHKRTLLSHLRLECGVAPQFQCTYCKKNFARKRSLKIHLHCRHQVLVE